MDAGLDYVSRFSECTDAFNHRDTLQTVRGFSFIKKEFLLRLQFFNEFIPIQDNDI